MSFALEGVPLLVRTVLLGDKADYEMRELLKVLFFFKDIILTINNL
jgi:hypothetical protein